MNPYFTKRQTNVIKGFAIILMFIHHFFAFPERYAVGIPLPEIDWFSTHFCGVAKICVALFCFLTGYLYPLQTESRKNLAGSGRKIIKFLIGYWVVYFPLLGTACVLRAYPYTIKRVLLEMIGIGCPVMIHCWYVTFFIIAMIALPFFHKAYCRDKKLFCGFITLCLFVGYLINGAIEKNNIENVFVYILQALWEYYPIVLLGYIFASEQWFEKLGEFSHRLPAVVQIIISVVLMIGTIYIKTIHMGGYFWQVFQKDILLTPIFVWAGIELSRYCYKALLPVGVLGKYSMYLWFTHCIFHSCLKEYTQWILYWPHYSVLILIWGLVICLAMAVPLSRLADRIIYMLRRLLIEKCMQVKRR